MASRFEELLVDVSRQVTGVERLLEATMQSQKELAREISALREKVAKLEKGKYEVSEADKRSERAIEKANLAMSTANAVLKYIEDGRKVAGKAASRRSSRAWFVLKTILQHSIPLVVSGIGTLVVLYLKKGGL